MTDNVIPLGGITRLDLPADRVLEDYIGEFDGVVLIGWNKDDEFTFASTYADGGTVVWLLEQAKKKLLEVEID